MRLAFNKLSEHNENQHNNKSVGAG